MIGAEDSWGKSWCCGCPDEEAQSTATDASVVSYTKAVPRGPKGAVQSQRAPQAAVHAGVKPCVVGE